MIYNGYDLYIINHRIIVQGLEIIYEVFKGLTKEKYKEKYNNII